MALQGTSTSQQLMLPASGGRRADAYATSRINESEFSMTVIN
jgi:hypothetical protein